MNNSIVQTMNEFFFRFFLTRKSLNKITMTIHGTHRNTSSIVIVIRHTNVNGNGLKWHFNGYGFEYDIRWKDFPFTYKKKQKFTSKA